MQRAILGLTSLRIPRIIISMEAYRLNAAAAKIGVKRRRLYQFIEKERITVVTDETTGVKLILASEIARFNAIDRPCGNPGLKRNTSMHMVGSIEAEKSHWEPLEDERPQGQYND